MRDVQCNTELTEDDKRRIETDESIIAVYHGKRGGVVYVHDTVLKTLSTDDMRRNIKRLNEAANSIVRDYCCRKLAKKNIKESKNYDK